MTIGEKIKARRTSIGMSADELGRRIGRSRATVYRLESGDISSFSPGALELLANALGVDVFYFFDEAEEVPLDSDHYRRNYLFEKYGTLMSDIDGMSEADRREVEAFIKFKMNLSDE